MPVGVLGYANGAVLRAEEGEGRGGGAREGRWNCQRRGRGKVGGVAVCVVLGGGFGCRFGLLGLSSVE